MKKEDNLISSQVLSEFYKTALDKGWLPKEELTKNASVETDRYSPTGNLIQDLVNLAFGLREVGLYSQAETLENKINVFKKAQYEMHNLIDQNSMALQQHAHPESAKVVETQSGWGMIHTNIDRQRKILETLTHQPKGVHQEAIRTVALAAADALGLLKFAQDSDAKAEAERELAGEEAGGDASGEEEEAPGLLPSGKLVDPDMARKVKANKKAVRTASAGILKSLSEINSELNKIKSGKIFSKEAILKDPSSNLSQLYIEANGFDQAELKKNYDLYKIFGNTEDSANSAIAGMNYTELQGAISNAAPSLSSLVTGVDYEVPAAGFAPNVKVEKQKGTWDFGEQEEVIKAKSLTQDDITASINSKSRGNSIYRKNPGSIWQGKMFIDEEGVTLSKNSLLQKESIRSQLAKSISEQIASKIQEYFSSDTQQKAGAAILAKYSTAINMLKKISASVKSSSLYEDRVEIFKDIAGKAGALLGYFNKNKDFSSLASGSLITGHVGSIESLAQGAIREFEANPISAELESPKVSAKKAAPILDKLSTTINDLKDLADYFKEKDPNGNDFKKTSRYYDTLLGIYQALAASKNKPWTEVQSAIASKSNLTFKNYESLDYWVNDTKQKVDEARAKSPGLGPRKANFRNDNVIKLGDDRSDKSEKSEKSKKSEESDVEPVVVSAGEPRRSSWWEQGVAAIRDATSPTQPTKSFDVNSPSNPDNPTPTAPTAKPEPPKPAGVTSPNIPSIPSDPPRPGGNRPTSGGGGGGKNRESLTEDGKAIYDMQAALQDLSNKIGAAKDKANPQPAGNDLSAMKASTDGSWGPQTATAINTAKKWITDLAPGPKGDKAQAEANTAKIKEYIADQGWAEGTRAAVQLDTLLPGAITAENMTVPEKGIPLKDSDLSNLSTFYKFVTKIEDGYQTLGWWIGAFDYFIDRVESLRSAGELGDPRIINYYNGRINELSRRFNSILESLSIDITDNSQLDRKVSPGLFNYDKGGGGAGDGGALGGGAGGAIGGAGMPGTGGGGAGGMRGGAGGDATISEFGYGGASDETPPFDADGINLDSPYFGGMDLGLSGGMFQSDWFKSRAFDVAIQLFASEHSDKPLTSESYAETQNFACVNDYLEFLAKLRSAISGAYRSYLAGNAPQASKASVGRSLNAYVRAIQSHIKQLQDIIRQMQRGSY